MYTIVFIEKGGKIYLFAYRVVGIEDFIPERIYQKFCDK